MKVKTIFMITVMVLLIGSLIYAKESLEKQFFENASKEVKDEFIKVQRLMSEKNVQEVLDEKIKEVMKTKTPQELLQWKIEQIKLENKDDR